MTTTPSINRPRKLMLIRHAESARNAAKKGNIYFPEDTEERRQIRGVADHLIPITEKGWAQARALGKALESQCFYPDYIYHSGYKRTMDTTTGILEAYPDYRRRDFKIRQNLFIRERDSGHAYDMTTAEAQEAFPWLDEHWKTAGYFFAHPPGGESQAQVCERVYLFLGKLFRERQNQEVMVVTHGGTIRAFRFLLEHWTCEQAEKQFLHDPPKQCSVTTYEGDADQLYLKDYNVVYPV